MECVGGFWEKAPGPAFGRDAHPQNFTSLSYGECVGRREVRQAADETDGAPGAAGGAAVQVREDLGEKCLLKKAPFRESTFWGKTSLLLKTPF